MGIVWNDMKGTNQSAKDGTTEFGQDVSTTLVAGDHNHWAKVMWSHLPVQGLFELCVPHQDKTARREVIVMDLRDVLPGEVVYVTEIGSVDLLAELG